MVPCRSSSSRDVGPPSVTRSSRSSTISSNRWSFRRCSAVIRMRSFSSWIEAAGPGPALSWVAGGRDAGVGWGVREQEARVGGCGEGLGTADAHRSSFSTCLASRIRAVHTAPRSSAIAACVRASREVSLRSPRPEKLWDDRVSRAAPERNFFGACLGGCIRPRSTSACQRRPRLARLRA
jgi:hypothetical protein